jgi:hypothetical protein
VGADEPKTSCWNHSAPIRTWLAANGYVDADGTSTKFDQGMSYLSSYFSAERQLIVTGQGKQQIGWDEMLEHGPSVPNTVIQLWHDKQPMLEQILRQGYRAVVSNYADSYLDCGFGHWIVGAKDAGGGKVVERQRRRCGAWARVLPLDSPTLSLRGGRRGRRVVRA